MIARSFLKQSGCYASMYQVRQDVAMAAKYKGRKLTYGSGSVEAGDSTPEDDFLPDIIMGCPHEGLFYSIRGMLHWRCSLYDLGSHRISTERPGGPAKQKILVSSQTISYRISLEK